MKIRLMRNVDLPEVAALYQEANSFAQLKTIFEWTKKGLRDFPGLNFVCEKEGKVIGAFSAVLEESNSALVNDIAVSEKHREKGIGKKLMQKLLSELKQRKVRRVRLWVHHNNLNTLPFYESFGFLKTKSEKTKEILGVPDGEEITWLELEV